MSGPLTPQERDYLRAGVRHAARLMGAVAETQLLALWGREQADQSYRQRGAERALHKARNRLDAARALHQRDMAGTACEGCWDSDGKPSTWPCPTIGALGAPDA